MAKTYRILRMLNKKSSGILYNFTPNKSYALLLNSESDNLVFLRTYSAVVQFGDITITFTDQDNRTLETEVN